MYASRKLDLIGLHIAHLNTEGSHAPIQCSGMVPSGLNTQVGDLLGEDFSDVRVHADSFADATVRSEGAVALVRGNDLFVAPWAYHPEHPLGRGLIAHELTHVAQQRLGRNTARDGFLAGTGHEYAIQGLMAERREGAPAANWDQITSKQAGLTPAPPGMTQRCISGCKSCQEGKGPSVEERKATLTAEAKLLKTTIDNPGQASVGELAAANAKYTDVMHDLKVLERGYGTHVGSRASDLGQGQESAPTKTDCTEYTVSVLRDTFNAKGQGDTFKKILVAANKESGGRLKGTSLIDELRKQGGWKVLYWNPDTKFVDKKRDNTDDTEHKYSADVARTKGTYYDIPLETDKMIVDYSPKAGTGTARNDVAIDKLRKIPFGVIAARGGMHIAMLVSGIVYEVHWTEQCTSEEVFAATSLEKWGWLSGIVAAPASDIDNAWK